MSADVFDAYIKTQVEKCDKQTIIQGIVTTITGKTATVSVQNDAEFFDVRMCAITDAVNNYIMAIPALNTPVVIGIMTEGMQTEAVILQCSEVQAWEASIAGKVMRIDAYGLSVKCGTDTLLVALQLIIQAIKQVMVMYGNNPDYLKLQQADIMLQNLLQ